MLNFIGEKQIHGEFTHEGISYPANWLSVATLKEKTAIGITMYEEIFPELVGYQYWLFDSYVDDPIAKTRTYEVAQVPGRTKTVTEDYTVTTSDGDLFVDASKGSVTITFPSVAETENFQVSVTKIDSSDNEVTVQAYESDHIKVETETTNTVVIEEQDKMNQFLSDSSVWSLGDIKIGDE